METPISCKDHQSSQFLEVKDRLSSSIVEAAGTRWSTGPFSRKDGIYQGKAILMGCLYIYIYMDVYIYIYIYIYIQYNTYRWDMNGMSIYIYMSMGCYWWKEAVDLAGFRAGVMATIAINTVRLGRAGGQSGPQMIEQPGRGLVWASNC